jgi:hypothetical protein
MIMAEWIKLEKNTPDKPEVSAVARWCNVSHGDAFTAIVRLLIWADGNTEDGFVRFLSASDADRIGNLCGLGEALIKTGWLHVEDNGATFQNWNRHNGTSAKRRMLDSERKSANRRQNVRKMSASDAEVFWTREEKRREEKNREENRTANSQTGEPPAPVNAQTAVTGNGKDSKEPKPMYSQDFEDFWGMYPNRKAKGEAWKAWNQMRSRLPAIGELLAIVAQQSRQSDWTRDGGKFIPHPATWLRACRWEDGKSSSPSKQATAIVDAQPKPRPTHINHEPITDPEILGFDDETFARFRIEMEKHGAYFS